ncbi:phage tail-collar fiber domain-containing protein [Fusobacterium varium]
MAYNGLTNAGAAYLAARQANNLPVEFLKAKVGNGIVPSGTDPADLTDIISEKMEVEITDIQQAERTLKMTVQVSNESLTTGFYLTEIAIFVNDNGTQVLYWYIGKDNGIPVHDSTKPMKYKNILNIEVSSTPVTTVNYTGKDLWIDEETLNAKFGTKEKEILEGIQLARTLGLEYGGELNNSNTKKLNTVYYDTQNKSFFKCFRENTLNYADSNYYEGISNNDLLLKLQNLTNEKQFRFEMGNVAVALTKFGKIIMCVVQHQGGAFNAGLPVGTIPLDFRGEYTTYLTVPCITGSPYIALRTDGSVEFRLNDATFQILTTNTSYFLTQSYFSKLY